MNANCTVHLVTFCFCHLLRSGVSYKTFYTTFNENVVFIARHEKSVVCGLDVHSATMRLLHALYYCSTAWCMNRQSAHVQ